jgi:hypothetical protein
MIENEDILALGFKPAGKTVMGYDKFIKSKTLSADAGYEAIIANINKIFIDITIGSFGSDCKCETNTMRFNLQNPETLKTLLKQLSII